MKLNKKRKKESIQNKKSHKTLFLPMFLNFFLYYDYFACKRYDVKHRAARAQTI